MTKNQVFEILKQAGGVRAARIIVDNLNSISVFRLYWIVRQLRRGVPVAKIINQRWFFGLKFYTNKYTLDPRPDTETLVSAVISDYVKNCELRILDLGTGTGCIIASLVKNIFGASGVGIDKSWRAIKVARKNVRDLGLGQDVKIIRADFSKLNKNLGLFDVIVSNPPYIARGDRRVDCGAMYDPDIALYADDNGLSAYRVIAKNAGAWLKNGGKIYLEIGQGQTKNVKDIFSDMGWRFLRTECDLAGVERVLVFAKGGIDNVYEKIN